MEYAGANNPLYLLRDGEIIETKADKHPIGSYIATESKPFTNHEIDICNGDLIYMFTDGFADQFGGTEGKKFKYKKLRRMLIEGSAKPMIAQKLNIHNMFEQWQGEYEQVDDVLLTGIKV
ncbi:SpoIIE family protein phosphatase [candidate division KSB1 bacterium]|nr:SpoIIE family protein phosphatase [candidate division KSB1 bacterium]